MTSHYGNYVQQPLAFKGINEATFMCAQLSHVTTLGSHLKFNHVCTGTCATTEDTLAFCVTSTSPLILVSFPDCILSVLMTVWEDPQKRAFSGIVSCVGRQSKPSVVLVNQR